MNIIRLALINLIAAATALAENPQFEIEARYEGFPPSLLANLKIEPAKGSPNGVLALPRFTTKAGQTGAMAIGRETVLPVSLDGRAPSVPRTAFTTTATNFRGETTIDGRKTVFCGVTLEVSPEIKDGQIYLSGKSTIRQPLFAPGAVQPSNAVSFSTRESVFSDKVTSGQPMVVKAGEGPDDLARITLTVRVVAGK
jgi:Flp pilus assembly secretin CpaC